MAALLDPSSLPLPQPLAQPSSSNLPEGTGDRIKPPAPIWWSNAIFFVGMHLMALVGIFYLSPWWNLDTRTMWLCIASWQLATFGITLGYHRLWSHRAYSASFALRCVLAGMGCLGFQGSIRWWVLRHRLHHRFTDTDSDPYDATKGLYHSHMGWIFRKPEYPRMALVERKDLDADPVVRFQHKYYLPLTLGLGIVAPTLIGWSYGDTLGGYVWGGIVARITIWHFTFFINSLAHYLGEQAYSEDVTARGNFLLALFTGGEANHNYHHCFPKDYRNGPRALDWDPTKWAIYLLHHFTPFVPSLHQTPESEILKARSHVLSIQADHSEALESTSSSSSLAFWSSYASATSDDSEGNSTVGYSSSAGGYSSSSSDDSPAKSTERRAPLRNRRSNLHLSEGVFPIWTEEELVHNVVSMDASKKTGGKRSLVVVIDGYAVDATGYSSMHPGGTAVLREYAVRVSIAGAEEGKNAVVDATEAFGGGLNDHGWSAKEKMRSLRIAKIVKS